MALTGGGSTERGADDDNNYYHHNDIKTRESHALLSRGHHKGFLGRALLPEGAARCFVGKHAKRGRRPKDGG